MTSQRARGVSGHSGRGPGSIGRPEVISRGARALQRPAPGTFEADHFTQLQAEQSRAGRGVDLIGCAELAHVIEEHGHMSDEARSLARALGIRPQRIPRRRGGR
jgi:hypothetical protein